MPADATPTPDLAAIEAHLTGPGQPFELEQTTILGHQVTAFKNRPRSLRDVLQRSSTFGNADYMVWQDGRRYTYAEHLDLVATLAANLASIHGIKPGDRVAILAANCPEWVLTFWAVTSLGAVAVGLNAWWTADEILYGIADCQPALLIADEKRLARLSAEQLASLSCWVLPIDSDFEAALREAQLTPAALPTTPITEEMPAVMLYTSGTTGRPKAAVHTHGNLGSLLMVSFFHGARLMALKPPAPDATPNCILVTSPLFHVSGLHCAAVTGLGGGAKTVWTMGRFEPLRVLELIQDERVTGWGYTATMLHRVVNHPRARKFDLSSLRMMGGGGSPIPAPLQEQALSWCRRCARPWAWAMGSPRAAPSARSTRGPSCARTPRRRAGRCPRWSSRSAAKTGSPCPRVKTATSTCAGRW